MSYIKPSVLVYQELQNAGGVANVTPDLGCTIVGPLYNIVRVDPLSPVSLSAALTKTLTAQTDFFEIDEVTPLTSIEIPLSQGKPGQIVDTGSVTMHVQDARVHTLSFDYPVGDNTPANNKFLNDNKCRFVIGEVIGVNWSPKAGLNPSHDRPYDELLPDGSGAHIAANYEVEITYDSPDEAGTAKTTIRGIVTEVETFKDTINNKVRIVAFKCSTPVPDFSSVNATVARVRIFKKYPYFVLPDVDSQFGFSNIDDDIVNITTVAYDGQRGFKSYASVTPNATVEDYLLVAGKFSPSYKALRQDMYSTIISVGTTAERESLLGEATEENPLSLAVDIAIQNTTKSVFAMSLKKDGTTFEWSRALEMLEGHRDSYAIVPLTQDDAVLAEFHKHCRDLSTPELASWRVTIGNTAIPESLFIVANADDPHTSGTCKTVDGTDFLSDLTEAFVGKSVTPGDIVVVTACTTTGAVGTYVIDEVVNNNVLKLNGFTAASNGDSVTYYIIRTLTRRQRAEKVAAVAATFGASGGNRMWLVQPDVVGVDVQGVTKYLPGYYLAAALGGLTSGEPVQQGFTNMPIIGITDLQNSNFYFNREELGIMAASGVCLFVQATQGGVPYCRHALTTDMTVLEYREILKVKNWDFLSFYFYDKLKGFIGTWNITPDTLSNMRQVINASVELLKGQKLPRIGSPLLSGTILELQQNAVNKDNIDIRLQIEIVSPNNYTNLYLII